jgi:type III pantothenate kinase
MIPLGRNRLVIAVDIGSTRTHVGIVDCHELRCLFRSDFPSADIPVRLPVIIDKVKSLSGQNSPVPAVIAGGNGRRTQEAASILKRKNISHAIRLQWNRRIPITLDYTPARSLGADRIADALYAVTVFPKRNICIIDSGTAVTIDAINRSGRFIGGAILAGIGTQLSALHASTATLPQTAIPKKNIRFPGNATIPCMQAGAAYGTAGALNLLVQKYRVLLGGKVTVLATGGAWKATNKLVDFTFVDVPDMTLIGTALYYAVATE